MKRYFFLVLAVLFPIIAWAGDPQVAINAPSISLESGSTAGGNASVIVNNSTGVIKLLTNSVERWRVDASGNVYQDATNGGHVQFTREFYSVRKPPAAVITPATAFPTPGGVALTKSVTLVASAVPTAAYALLPASTPYIGVDDVVTVVNLAESNPLALVPQGADVINAAAAGTPFACAGTKTCECGVVSAGQWSCGAK